jgi:hypothetical protein
MLLYAKTTDDELLSLAALIRDNHISAVTRVLNRNFS